MSRNWLSMGLAAAAFAGALAIAPAASAASDPWITTKVKLSLLTSEGVDGLDVNVDTNDGRVTLHGTASTPAERSKAEQLAKQTEGVREVRNLIQVVPEAKKDAMAASDEKIEKDVEAALASDQALSGSRITVQSVNKGAVLLAGEAKSLSAHLRAIEDAHSVDGVTRVASEIESPDKLADEEIWRDTDVAAAPSTTRSAANDLWTTSAAKVRLVAADVPALDINVDTRGGVVTLFGTVGSDAQKRTAEAEVRKVSGVTQVRNKLEVVPAKRQEAVEQKDEDIREAVSKRLSGDDDLSDSHIDIQVENGVVRLTGKVESQSDRLAALTLARGSSGVRSVIGDLRVERN
jgi:osmotically-inducible protein OsmY